MVEQVLLYVEIFANDYGEDKCCCLLIFSFLLHFMTDRQTDRQTDHVDRQTDRQSVITKFPSDYIVDQASQEPNYTTKKSH